MHKTERTRFALTVDIIVFSEIQGIWNVLLIQRKKPPFQDAWAFPGGFVEFNEKLNDAAHRELYSMQSGFEQN